MDFWGVYRIKKDNTTGRRLDIVKAKDNTQAADILGFTEGNNG